MKQASYGLDLRRCALPGLPLVFLITHGKRVRSGYAILTIPAPLPYHSYDELVTKLKPGVHGVILTSGNRKGLLLPQVWARLPDAD